VSPPRILGGDASTDAFATAVIVALEA